MHFTSGPAREKERERERPTELSATHLPCNGPDGMIVSSRRIRRRHANPRGPLRARAHAIVFPEKHRKLPGPSGDGARASGVNAVRKLNLCEKLDPAERIPDKGYRNKRIGRSSENFANYSVASFAQVHRMRRATTRCF